MKRAISPLIRRVLGTLPPAFWGLIVVCVFALFTQPQFLSLPFLLILLRQAAPLGIVALGQTFVVVNRSLDLSVGATIAFINIIVSDRIWIGVPVGWIILTVVVTGVLIGTINGLLVTKLRASAVVVTLGTGAIITGAGLFLSGGAPGNAMHGFIKWLGRGRYETIPVSGIIWIVTVVVCFILLKRLVIGRNIYASGDNPSSARYSGIPVDTTLLLSHIICSVCAALGGLILSGLIGVGSLNLGADYVLSSITAVILGGAVFGGGAGGAIGTMLGTALLIMMLNLMTVFGIDEPGKLIVQGLVIAVAAALHQQSLGKKKS